MYQFSRAIYRDIAMHIDTREVPDAHHRVLRSCEATVERLAADRHYFARPARTLFNDIRLFFPMTAQARVWQVVQRHLQAADEFLLTQPRNGVDVNGNPVECRATTRRGTPCQRMPLPHNGYCPSHQHLAATEEREAAELAFAA